MQTPRNGTDASHPSLLLAHLLTLTSMTSPMMMMLICNANAYAKLNNANVLIN